MTETLPSCNLVVLLSLYSVVITKTNLPNSLARTLNPLIETVDRFGRESKAVRYWNSLVHCFCVMFVVVLLRGYAFCCVIMHLLCNSSVWEVAFVCKWFKHPHICTSLLYATHSIGHSSPQRIQLILQHINSPILPLQFCLCSSIQYPHVLFELLIFGSRGV